MHPYTNPFMRTTRTHVRTMSAKYHFVNDDSARSSPAPDDHSVVFCTANHLLRTPAQRTFRQAPPRAMFRGRDLVSHSYRRRPNAVTSFIPSPWCTPLALMAAFLLAEV